MFKKEETTATKTKGSYNFEDIKRLLGKPYFETDNCFIYNVDCLSAMKKIEREAIDLTVTSPPYNIGKEYETDKPIQEYIDWCKQWMNEVYGITKQNGSFWLNLGYFEFPQKAKALPITYLLWDKTPFYLIQEVVWNYGAGVAAKKFLSPRNEKFLWYVKNRENYLFNLDNIRDKNVKYPNQKKNGRLRCNPLGKNPSDVWQIQKVTSGKDRSSKERTEHPAQFPEALIDRIILASSNKKEVILDPFLGSGTSAISALKNERKIIGFEISKKYCGIAEQRIIKLLENQKQKKLFS
ncbi:MAG: modification methylase [Candidatus Jacksonbacteria bacterium RIFOXYC2_FULL_44_29]|nr:MAG: modification methylase [Candidatus Jacksonbacteria bacterium RIFOXYA2_FULL_43_12]OGY77778.1 MAG: modification methylase [Candidatus Jacksonbacteria bacterium RIFOXYB2_FULL_44_15]OGY78289.1 MAG: modification methylase [Candidatus Jacksonbacteria bacterium RIFOXYC2_FULL_44_29]OGY78928.1 MAG: modification methylase [Candidatus Jacksonbacteria bacterium RIFOXYD2_FULL_43_21]